MEKPKFFFYQFPTGGPKFTLWPLSGGGHRLDVNSTVLGRFDDTEKAVVEASRVFSEMHPDPDLADTAERMLDLDWWERSPVSRPQEALQ